MRSILPLLAALLVASSAVDLWAQELTAARSVSAGLYISPPFVMEEGDGYTGMAVEIWEDLAENLGLAFEYRVFPTFRTLVDALAKGEIDVAVTNLTITQGRAQRIDFTQPWFDAGLRIMVNQNRQAGFRDIVTGLQDSGYLRAYGWLAFIIIVATLAVTLFDRRFDKDFPPRWRDGLAESFHHVMSIATSGSVPSRKNLFGWVGRIWQGLWLVFGVAVVAYVTSSVTSVMTTLSLTNQINSLADLPGKTVGVFTGSVAEEFAGNSGLAFRTYPDINDAVDALVAGRISAIVGDAPVLEYYAHVHPAEAVTVVGAIFEPDKYGFGLPHGSALTHPLTVELLGAYELGRVDELRVKYFGNAP